MPFPFTDLSSAKVRPALVLVPPMHDTHDMIVAFMSSRMDGKDDRSVSVQPSSSNGLKVPSLIRLSKLATLDRRIALGTLGKIDKKTLLSCQEILRKMFVG